MMPLFMSLMLSVGFAESQEWPDISTPIENIGIDGSKDSALIIAIERYRDLSNVSGAVVNGEDWEGYFETSMGIPDSRIRGLYDGGAFREEIERVAKDLSKNTPAGGRIWLVYIGHGADYKGEPIILDVDARRLESSFGSCGNDCPVESVSWYDAVSFANKLSVKEGLEKCYEIDGNDVKWVVEDCSGWRLPTEAEWEYAARGGENYKYAGSNNLSEVAWHKVNSGRKTHVVGQKKANGYGLYDMSGNVYEWCWDWYGKDYYSSSTEEDPKGPSSGSDRVTRGGSWGSSAWITRVSFRGWVNPSNTNYDVGFRLIRTK